MHLNIYISSAFKLVVDSLYIPVDLFPMLVSDRNPGRSLQFYRWKTVEFVAATMNPD
jgi:hypothetical protein